MLCLGCCFRSRSEGGLTFGVHHNNSLHALLALKPLQCLLHLCLAESKGKVRGGWEGQIHSLIPLADESHMFSKNTQVTPPQRSPGLSGAVPRPPLAPDPCTTPPAGAGLLLALCPPGTIFPPASAIWGQEINTIPGSKDTSVTHVFGIPGGQDTDDLKNPNRGV